MDDQVQADTENSPVRRDDGVAVTRAEVIPLAQELATASCRWVDYYLTKMGMSPEEALAQARKPMPDCCREELLHGPPHQVSWHGLNELAQEDPELAARRWEQVKAAARDELVSGHRAARKVEDHGAGPWERAQFAALRSALAEDWQPRGGMEWLLIDQLAQAYTEQERWLKLANLRLSLDASRHDMDEQRKGKWVPPRLTEAQSCEQAMAMSERWHGIFLKTLRALRDLRPAAPALLVGMAGQVNVGGQQVNVAGAGQKGE
jgi:hypothetical protein